MTLKALEPKCYKTRVESERFIMQSVDIEPSGVTLSMKKSRVKENFESMCKRQGLKCKIKVTPVPCSRKGSGKGKIREFVKWRKPK